MSELKELLDRREMLVWFREWIKKELAEVDSQLQDLATLELVKND